MADKSSHGVSFVVPALNEENVIEGVVREIWHQVDSLLQTFEIILINDGSSDGTGEIMESLSKELAHVSVMHNKKCAGLGKAYKKGLAEAKQAHIMMLCGDGGLPAASLPAILGKLGEADIIAPYMKNLRQIKTPARLLLSLSYSGLLNLIFGYKLQYYNGLPVHKTELVRALTIKSGGFGFQGEILIKLFKAGYSCVEVGVYGAEETNKSSALRVKNLFSVGLTFLHLIKHLQTYRGVRE